MRDKTLPVTITFNPYLERTFGGRSSVDWSRGKQEGVEKALVGGEPAASTSEQQSSDAARSSQPQQPPRSKKRKKPTAPGPGACAGPSTGRGNDPSGVAGPGRLQSRWGREGDSGNARRAAVRSGREWEGSQPPRPTHRRRAWPSRQQVRRALAGGRGDNSRPSNSHLLPA